MERGNELMDKIQAQNTRMEAMFERQEAMFGDFKVFMREITLRVERGGREMVRELRGLQDETKAQTRALLLVIDRMDRLDPGGSVA